MTQHLNSRTMPDFFALRYNSNGLKIAASIIVFIFLIPYTASLFNGLSRLFTMAFPGVDYAWCVIVMAVLTGVYVIVGGYMATAVNDFIQGIIMIFGILAVIFAVLHGQGGISEAIAKLSQTSSWTSAGTEFKGAYTSFLGADPIFLFFVIILTSLGTWGLPQMVGKFYAIKSESSITKGTIISTFFAIVVAGGCYFLGGFGRLFTTQEAVKANGYDSIVPSMLSGLDSDFIIGIVLVLVLSASMSTLSSLVLTSSSTITLDLIAPAAKKFDEKKKVVCMRVFVAFFIAVSAIIAIVQSNPEFKISFIAQLMGVSWGALAGAFLAPFLYSLYWKKTTKASVWVSFASGVGIMVANLICTFTGTTFITPFFSSPINAGVLAMLVGLVLVPVVSLVTPKMKKEDVDSIFSCYSAEVVVHAKSSLKENDLPRRKEYVFSEGYRDDASPRTGRIAVEKTQAHRRLLQKQRSVLRRAS